MTYKQPDGLDPRRYRKRTSAQISRSFVRRSEDSPYPQRERRTAPVRNRSTRKAVEEREAVAASTRGRVHTLNAGRGGINTPLPRLDRRRVTMPQEAVQPLTWAERHARYRNQAAPGGESEEVLVPRTLAQTGRPAVAGQTCVRKPGSTRESSSRVPVRRGQARPRGNLWRRLAGLFFILAILFGSLIFALAGPTFHIQQVVIDGTQNRQLIAEIQRLGIQGQDIFLFNQGALITRVETLPQIASATLGVQLPHTVVVSVQERAPVLLWQAGKTTYGLAQDGTIIAPVAQLSDTEHLALVLDARHNSGQLRPGARLNAADIVFIEQIFEQVPGIAGVSPFSLQYVDTISQGGHSYPANVAGSGSYVLISANGWRAYLGDSQNSTSLANRLQELQEILNIARQQNIRLATIDLRFGIRPTYTLKA